ncbi:DUF2157 domain-containing protein [Phycicoccus sp. BSK3Z-2]|uniref:DUF2157 domain-containing protein n=1 Tax=Phycicoccus avicenniae TaxID=2828860 RepID=A0A941D816_9MICO|nr:DUF2157 domain-containing protein [Phycicoccus avicenniae]MBR7743518.1 DUF2157 domain-containing protein [Phycicoccus avicenniae]
MTAPPTAPPPPSPTAPGEARPPVRATPSRLAWLEDQLDAWAADGLLDAGTAASIRGRYVAHRRVTLARIVLTLGAAFVGLGVIWLVAANLDDLSPLVRFALVVLLWLGLVTAAETVAARTGGRREDEGSPLVGALRLLAVAAFGAVVFQAAQSLQVPAYEPSLVGIWALGALVYGYAVGGVSPVLVGIVLSAGWVVWHVVDTATDPGAAVVAVAAVGLGAVALGVLHGPAGRRGLVPVGLGLPWREVGAVLALGALFVAALPFFDAPPTWSVLAVVVLAAAVLLAGASLVPGAGATRVDRLEVGVGAAVLAAALVLVSWSTSTSITDPSQLAAGDLARAVVAVVVYLAVASGYAVLGGMRGSGRLTWVATGALVVFTTTQAFAVFAPVLSGAVLFLAVGLVLLGTGVLADRGRRRLVAEGRAA